MPVTGAAAAGVDPVAALVDALNAATSALSSRQVIAGAGLTGGGTLAADRTFAVDFASSGVLSNTYAKRSRGITTSRGAFCFTWDDGYAYHDTIRQMADARGQRHTFAVTTGSLGNANRLTNAQVLAAYQAGHEISAHSVTHTDVTTQSVPTRTGEYDTSKSVLEGIIGSGNVSSWTYPFGSLNRNATTDAELWGRFERILNTGSNTGDSGSPYVYPRDELVPGRSPFLIGRFPWTSTNHDRVLSLIRQAQHSPIVIVTYAHDPGTANNPTIVQVQEAIDLCVSLGVDCLTTAEAFPAHGSLVDTGFEDSALSNWFPASTGSALAESIVDTPSTGLTGTRSLHLQQNDAGGSGFVYVTQQVPVLPSTAYTLTFRYRSNTSGISFTRPRARTRDYLGGTITQNQANLTNVQATWTQGTLAFTTEATAVSVSIDFIININTGDAWFDHVHLAPTRLGSFG